MFRIKLLILSLVSFIFISCTNSITEKDDFKYSIGYISGEYDGLILRNLLKNYLQSFNLYDENSHFEIKSSINHKENVYITNIDNTSDRTNVDSYLNIEIIDNINDCSIFKFDKNISQFHILADSSKYISNNIAVEKMKTENTENLVKDFINNLNQKKNDC
tara:strand:- start:1396 stop:1878 length:483 start_codon:yes stop_codon:yes gene_type:complete